MATTSQYGKIATSPAEVAANKASLQAGINVMKSAPAGTPAGAFAGTGQYASTFNSAVSGGGVSAAPVGTDRVNGVSVNPNVPNATGTAYNPAMAPVSPIASPAVQNSSVTPPGSTPYAGSSIVDALNSQGAPSSFADRSQMAQQQGIPGYTGTAEQNNQLLNKFKQALPGLQASGQVPTSAGDANAAVQRGVGAVNQDAVQPSIMGNIMETDKSFDSILTEYDKFHSPIQQKKSLIDEYKGLSDSLGINKINTDLIDAKRIIEGTEDDVRLEVEKAGGFATDSQVVALSNARNKSLIKNYNYLLESRDSAMTQLNTMMNLTIQDRQMAEAEFDRKMNYAFKVQDYKQKAISDAREGFNNYIKTAGADSFLASMVGNASSIARAENILGYPPGGLTQASIVATQQRAMDMSKENLQLDVLKSNLQTDALQRKKISSEIAKIDREGNIVTDYSGKVMVNDADSLKINKELVSNDAYKGIQKGKDSLNTLKGFEDTFNKTGATSAVFSPRQNAKLKAEYNASLLNLKEFFNLGAPQAVDLEMLKAVLPDPTNRSAFLTTITGGIYKPSTSTKSGLDNMKKMIETSLDDKFTSLTSQYGAYSSQSITSLGDLGRQYIEQKLVLHPEGFDITVNGSVGHVNPDGTVTPK